MGVLDFINTGLQAGAQVLNQINMKKTWEREDNAVQRRVKDLKRAGLSPTLAAGSAAGVSAPIRVEAPVFQRNVGVQEANIAQTKAQTDLNNLMYNVQEANSFEAQNRMDLLRQNSSESRTLAYDLARSQIQRQIRENVEVIRNAEIYSSYGLPNTPESARTIQDMQLLKGIMKEYLGRDLNSEQTTGATVLMRTLLNLIGGLR